MFHLRKNKVVDLQLNWKPPQSEILNKHEGPFPKISYFFKCFPLAIANQLPAFLISRLANAEDILNVNTFFKCKCKCEYERLFIKICVWLFIQIVCYLTLAFIGWPILQRRIWINSAAFTTTNSRHRFGFLTLFVLWGRRGMWMAGPLGHRRYVLIAFFIC